MTARVCTEDASFSLVGRVTLRLSQAALCTTVVLTVFLDFGINQKQVSIAADSRQAPDRVVSILSLVVDNFVTLHPGVALLVVDVVLSVFL